MGPPMVASAAPGESILISLPPHGAPEDEVYISRLPASGALYHPDTRDRIDAPGSVVPRGCDGVAPCILFRIDPADAASLMQVVSFAYASCGAGTAPQGGGGGPAEGHPATTVVVTVRDGAEHIKEGEDAELDIPQGQPGDGGLTGQLVQAHRLATRPRPSAKELSEALAFYHAVEGVLGGELWDVIVDVACAHGLLSLLWLAHGRAKRVVQIDKKFPPSLASMEAAWGDLLPSHADTVERLEEDFRGCLPRVLRAAGAGAGMLVVASHACGALTDDVLAACAEHGVACAVMPCCHVDTRDDPARGQVAHAAAGLGIPLGAAMELVRMGRMQERGYEVWWRAIDAKVTPDNRLLICRAAGRGAAGAAGLPCPPAGRGGGGRGVGLSGAGEEAAAGHAQLGGGGNETDGLGGGVRRKKQWW